MIVIDCPDATVRRWLEAWIAACRLRPGAECRIEVQVTDRIPTRPEGRRAFRQPTLAIYAGGAERTRVVWELHPAAAELAPHSRLARVWLSPGALAHLDTCQRTFFLAVLVLLMRRAGWHHLHAGTAQNGPDTGWLIAGNTRAGKSTTVALLASLGWSVGGDDVTFLSEGGDGVTAHAYRTPIALRRTSKRLLGVAGGSYLEARDKTGYWPEELGARWISSIRPNVLLFTKVGASDSRAEPLAPGQVLARLVRWSPWVALEPELTREHLKIIEGLTRQVRSFAVTLGADLFGQPERLKELVR